MNISRIDNGTTATAIQQADTAQVASKSNATTPSQSPSVVKDTVTISSAASQASQASQAAQEATETQAQTAKEAMRGDMQAKRLLAKETAAAEEAKEPANVKSQEAKEPNG